MQKQTSVDLYSSPNCKQFITTFSSGNHKSHHQKVSSAFMLQLLPDYMCVQTNKSLKTFFQQVKKNLMEVRDSINKKIESLDQHLSKYNLVFAYDLSEQESNSCMSILENKFNKFNLIRCCNVYEIYSKIFQGAGKPISNNLIETKIKSIANVLQTEFSQCFKNYNSFFEKYRTANNLKPASQLQNRQKIQINMTPKTSANSTISQRKDPPSKKQQLYSQNNEEQRPTRSQKRIERVEPINQQKSKFKKIKQLDQVIQNQRFDIQFKILKVIKTFKIKNYTKVLLHVGDQTGTCNCVLQMKPIIKNNISIQVTECRLYNFKDLQKQIQQTDKSAISSIADFRTINFKYTFGKTKSKRRQNQQKKQIRPHKQTKIKEGDREQRVRRRSRSRKSQVSQRKQQQQMEQYQYNLGQQQIDSEREQIIESSKDYGNGYTKISQIQPQMEGIDILAQIFKINDEDDKQGILCTLGDQTGIVKALLPKTLTFIKKGQAIKLTSVNAPVINQHIQIRTGKKTQIQQVRILFSLIKVDKDISAQQWVPQEQTQDT